MPATFTCAGCGLTYTRHGPPIEYYEEPEDPNDPYLSVCDRCMDVMKRNGFNREPVHGSGSLDSPRRITDDLRRDRA